MPTARAFEGRVALITGGGTGIGRAIAEGFVAEGGRAFVIGRREEPLRSLADEHPGAVAWTTADVGKAEDAPRIVQAAAREFGRLDLLVNNAASVPSGLLEATSDEQIDETMAVNLGGTLRLIREALPHLRESKGQIVNISSVVVSTNNPNWAIYGATKAGIEYATGALSIEFRPLGIRINTVAAGPTDIGGWVPEEIQREQAEARANNAGRPVLGAIGLPQDIANAVLLLADGRAGWITGQVIRATGGWTTLYMPPPPPTY